MTREQEIRIRCAEAGERATYWARHYHDDVRYLLVLLDGARGLLNRIHEGGFTSDVAADLDRYFGRRVLRDGEGMG